VRRQRVAAANAAGVSPEPMPGIGFRKQMPLSRGGVPPRPKPGKGFRKQRPLSRATTNKKKPRALARGLLYSFVF